MVKSTNKSNDSKVVQNVNIKIGDSTKKRNNKRRRAPNKTKKQEKPPLSNYQYPAVIYRDVPQKTTPQSTKQDETLAKQIQLKFDEEYAKRENEKATKSKVNVPGAFNSIDDGNGMSQEVSKINKEFYNDSSKPNNAVMKADNLFQRSNLLNEIKATPLKVDPVNIAIADEQIQPANASIYCEICGGSYKLNTQKRHFATQKHIKALKKEEDDLAQTTEQPERQQPIPSDTTSPSDTPFVSKPPSTIQRKKMMDSTAKQLEQDFEDIQNKTKREVYLQFANDLIDRKSSDMKNDKQNFLLDALQNEKGPEAMSLKREAFNAFKANKERYDDELEQEFQRALNGGVD
jgi:hypothetical protein